MKSIFALFLVCFSATQGFFIGGGSGPEWNSLRVTWGPNPLNSDYFAKQPLTVQEAKKSGYQEVSNQCEGKFLGQRFIHENDVGMVLIYDVKGNIAGIQMGIPASMIDEKHYKFSQQKMYNRDKIAGIDAYILTAYFVDPKTICQTNGIANRPKQGITGTGLWLQNGTDPIRDSFQVPLYQTEVNQTKWVQGACFPSMGLHHWYDNRIDTDCDLYFPSFLLYNKGKLTGFGWATLGKFEYTKRTEFPPLMAITSFLKPVPTCMPEKYNQAGGFTTMHIYFNADAWNLLC